MLQGTYGDIFQLATEITRQSETARDVIADTRQLTVRTDEGVPQLFGHAQYGETLRSHAIHQVGSHLGIHRNYVEKMRAEAPHLLDTNLNHWLQEQPSARMVRSLDGEVRAFMSDKYRRIDNEPILKMALEQLTDHSGVNISSCDVTPAKMYLKVTSPKLEGEVATGDPIQMGLVISNSEVGLGSFNIQPLIYRLVCQNGMIAAGDYGEGIRRRHLGARQMEGVLAGSDTLEAEGRAIALHARDAIRQLLSPETFQKHLQAFRDAKERKVEGDPVKAIEVLGKAVGFTQGEGSDIMRHLIEGGDLSQYGLTNAVTAYAQTVDSYDRSTALEEIAGKIITLKPNQWRQVAEAA